MPDADLLRSLHVPGKPIVLPNAWDAASAKVIEAAGFPALATTSGGVAAALGYEDHEGAPAEDMLAAAGRISGSVEIPVTVDSEAGYGMEPAELVAALIDARRLRLQPRGHRQRDRHPARSRRARRVAAARSARPRATSSSSTLASTPSSPRSGPGPTTAARASWSPKRSSGPAPTSRPAPTASTRSCSGKPSRCAPSSPRPRGRSTSSACRPPPRSTSSPRSGSPASPTAAACRCRRCRRSAACSSRSGADSGHRWDR